MPSPASCALTSECSVSPASTSPARSPALVTAAAASAVDPPAKTASSSKAALLASSSNACDQPITASIDRCRATVRRSSASVGI